MYKSDQSINRENFIRLLFRGTVFFVVLYLYFSKKGVLASLVLEDFFQNPGWKHVIWLIFMIGMISHLLPITRITMGLRKSRPNTYVEPDKPYTTEELYAYVQGMNIKAWKVMLLWLCFNAVLAALYLIGIIGEAEMVLATFFYYLSDIICIMFFCPFQSWIMKNRCCVNCRIFDWGHFMIFTPMLFIKSFFSWSLFFTACVVLIRWEISYANHPERFWHGSNDSIRCRNCVEHSCRNKAGAIYARDDRHYGTR